jgi:hypothetical protein
MKRDYNCENISEGQQFHQIKKKKILKENYLSLQVIALKRRTTSAVGIPGYGLGQVQQCGVNSNQIQILSLPPFFCGVYVAQSAVFCVVFCRSLFFFILPFFFWPLHYLSFYLRILITPLVFSNFSWPYFN